MRPGNFVVLGSIVTTCLTAFLVAAQEPRVVNDEALRGDFATGNEWVSYNVNWSEQRYSPLTQINDTNVDSLGLGVRNPGGNRRPSKSSGSDASCP